MTATKQKLDTTLWLVKEFSFNGINYVSKFSPDSPLLFRVMNLSTEVFQEMNAQVLSVEVGDITDREEIQVQLDRINDGASHAVIELA